MKQQLFTIAEGPFYALANHVISNLRGALGKENEPMIVGGMAVQLHLIDMSVKAGMSPDFSQLRKTDDIDLDFPANVTKTEIKAALGSMPALETEIGGSLVFAEIVRNGDVKPIIKLTVMNDCDDINEEVKLNLSSGPEGLPGFNNGYQRYRYHRRVTMSFPHVSGGKAEFQVVSLEDLVATKAKNGRDKDNKDLASIAQVVKETGRELDFELMESSLDSVKDRETRSSARDRYQEFLGRLGVSRKRRKTEEVPVRKPLRQTMRPQ
jgi:hypothetical protein